MSIDDIMNRITPEISSLAAEIITGAAALILLIVVIVYLTTKKKYCIKPTIEYHAPEGMNPAEVGYALNGFVTPEDMTSLIYYWASHGHLSIEMTGEDAFTLRYLSDLDDLHKPHERQLFAALWNMSGEKTKKKSRSALSDDDDFRLASKGRTVTSVDLSSGLELAAVKACRNMRSEFERSERPLTVKSRDRAAAQLPSAAAALAMLLPPLAQTVEAVGLGAFLAAAAIALIFTALIAVMALFENAPLESAGLRMLFIGPFCAVMLLILVPLLDKSGAYVSLLPSACAMPFFLAPGLFEKGYLYRRVDAENARRLNAVGWILVIQCAVVYVLSFRNTDVLSFRNADISLWSAAAMGLSVVLCSALSPRIRALTEYGAGFAARCEGFRQFLSTAEKNRLEMLLEENPNYYYDVLPYAHVLGVSSVWLQKNRCFEAGIPGWFSVEYASPGIMANLTKKDSGILSRPVEKSKKNQ